jgi:serine/threonine protein kinase
MIERYKILEQFGEGGAGSVHKAWDTKLQRYVAIKMLLPPEQRQAAGAGDNLAAEAAALSSLQHPHIVAVFDFDTDGAEQFVVMEFINGETLEVTVRRGALLTEDFQQIAAEALEGLNAAHRQGMCHRDLKPSNIMFHWLPDGKWQTKLLDFGLANFGIRPAQQQLAGAGSVAGSIHFMAPEQFLHQPLDAKTDLYSLGCVLYYALTASFPCNGATVEEVMNAHLARQVAPLRSLRPDVNPLLTDWVMWLMSRQPEERPESAAAALQVMRGLLSGELKSLPVQRALKTQAVPGRTAVVAAPLTKDAGERARAAETTAVTSPAPRRTVPAPPLTRTSPARPAPAPSRKPGPPGRTRKVAKPAKSKTPLFAVLAVTAVIAGGVITFVLTRNRGESKEKEQEQVVQGVGEPPSKGLVIWFDASKGGRKDGGQSAAGPGDRIDQWDDRSPLAGNNAAQYHVTAARQEEKDLRRLTWQRVTDKFGLKGTHDLMNFDGSNCLVFGRDKDKVGDPVAGELSGTQLTWIAVFHTDPDESGVQTLLCARVGKEARAWDIFVREGRVFSGVRKAGGGENHVSLPWDARRGCHILAVVWDGSQDRLRQWVTSPDGITAQSTAINGTTDFGDLSDVRLGAMNNSTGPSKGYLKGNLATLLIYNRALDDAGREAAVDYLRRRYFGAPARK